MEGKFKNVEKKIDWLIASFATTLFIASCWLFFIYITEWMAHKCPSRLCWTQIIYGLETSDVEFWIALLALYVALVSNFILEKFKTYNWHPILYIVVTLTIAILIDFYMGGPWHLYVFMRSCAVFMFFSGSVIAVWRVINSKPKETQNKIRIITKLESS